MRRHTVLEPRRDLPRYSTPLVLLLRAAADGALGMRDRGARTYSDGKHRAAVLKGAGAAERPAQHEVAKQQVEAVGDGEALHDVAEAHRAIDRSIEDPAADAHGRRGIRIHLEVNQLGFEADAPLPQSCPEDTVAVIHRRFERAPGKRRRAAALR